MNLTEAAGSGDRRQALEELRTILADAIDARPGPQHLANLSRQFQAVLADLDGLPNPSEVSTADEIAARRVARRGSNPAHSA